MKVVMNNIHRLPLLIFLIFIGFINCINVCAQKEITLGSHLKNGHGNTTILKGEGIGMKIKVSKKSIVLKSLSINLIDRHPDSVSFYIRIFPLNEKTLGPDMGPNKIFTTSLKNNQIHVDLTDYKITVAGNFVIGLEWAIDINDFPNTISFHTGLLKKGIYYKEADEPHWKKIPLFGFDIELIGNENSL